MPLEIRELHIKVNVGEAAGAAAGGTSAPAPKSAKEEGEAKDRLVAQCVEQVLEILRERKER